MADIQTYIEQIESAIYGKDVRQAIVDALNQCYADASEGITPEITTSEITGGTRITITVGSVSKYVDVMNGADGTATDAQVETYVSSWLDDHPEATTTVEDGSITLTKLASDIHDDVASIPELKSKIDAATVHDNSVNEVKLSKKVQEKIGYEEFATNIVTDSTVDMSGQFTPTSASYGDWTAGTNYNVSTAMTPWFLMPQKITIKNNGTAKWSLLECIVSNAPDPTAEGSIYKDTVYENIGDGRYNRQNFVPNLAVSAGDTVVYETYIEQTEWKWIRLKCTGMSATNMNNLISFSCEYYHLPYPNLMTLKDWEDLEVKYRLLGNYTNPSASKKVYAIARCYPNTTYYFRGAYIVNLLTTGVPVVLLYDDKAVTGDKVYESVFGNSISFGSIPSRYVPQSDVDILWPITTIDGDSDRNNNLFRYTTPSDCKAKWIAMQMFDVSTSEYTPITNWSTWLSNPTSYDSTIENLVSSKINGFWNKFITRFYPIHYRLCTAEHFCLPTYDRNDQGSYFSTLNTEAPYHNATWVLFGDSLTDNYGGKSAKGDYFASKISRELGITIDNRAKAGSNINDGANGSYTDVSGIKILDAFIAELQAETIEEPQYITVAFGSNSIISQLGTSSDSSATKTTVCGAVKYFIETLRTNCPNAVIGFVLPPQSDWGNNSSTKSVEQGREAILSVLQLDEYAVPYIDMWKESGITVDMLPDGIHISSAQAQNLYYHAMRRFVRGL